MLRAVENKRENSKVPDHEKLVAVSSKTFTQLRLCTDPKKADKDIYFDIVECPHGERWLPFPQKSSKDNVQNDRTIIYAKSGVGKSTLARMMSDLYRKVNKTKGYIISDDKQKDKAYEGSGLIMVPYMDLLREMKTSAGEFDLFQYLGKDDTDNEMIILDDVECVPSEYEKQYIELTKILFQRARKYHLSPCIILHKLNNSKLTKNINVECKTLCFSPRCANNSEIVYFLRSHGNGISEPNRRMIKKFADKLGRLCVLEIDSPIQYCLGENIAIVFRDDFRVDDIDKIDMEAELFLDDDDDK